MEGKIEGKIVGKTVGKYLNFILNNFYINLNRNKVYFKRLEKFGNISLINNNKKI